MRCHYETAGHSLYRVAGPNWRGAALGQGGETVPSIESIDFFIFKYIGGRELVSGETFGSIFGLFGIQPLWSDPVPFDPFTDVASELDFITVDALVFDPDLVNLTDPNATAGNSVVFFYRARTFPISLGPPEPPPLLATTDKYISVGLGTLADPNSFGDGKTFVTFSLEIPTFPGPNQQRLRGLIDYDVAWSVELAWRTR